MLKINVSYCFIVVFFCTLLGFSQKTENDQKVFLITMDGLRWQELFFGVDSLLVKNKKYVKHTDELYNKTWAASPIDRRKILMPFVWTQVVKMGQIHGNRTLGSKVNLTNGMWFSYPGYNEILSGRADDQRIDSNAKTLNPNQTVLEQFANVYGKTNVAAFGSWTFLML